MAHLLYIDSFSVPIADLKPGWSMTINRTGHLLGIGEVTGSAWRGASFIEREDPKLFAELNRRIPAAVADITAKLDTAGFRHNLGA